MLYFLHDFSDELKRDFRFEKLPPQRVQQQRKLLSSFWHRRVEAEAALCAGAAVPTIRGKYVLRLIINFGRKLSQ